MRIAKHCLKSVRIRSIFGTNFPSFGLNKDLKSSGNGHFSRSDIQKDISESFQVTFCFLFFSEDVHQITVANITTNSIKNSNTSEFDPEHAIDGNFNGLYHAPIFDPVSLSNQNFNIKIDFGRPYSIRYFKYKIDDKQGFSLRIGGTTVRNDALFAGTYDSSSNEQVTFFRLELVKGQFAFLFVTKPPVAEFRLYEIEFFGI